MNYLTDCKVHYYRPQTKFAKLMFLHVSVSHSVHGRGVYPSMPCRFPGSHPGELEGFGRGGVGGVQAHTQGEVEGSGLGGSPGPYWGGSPGPHLGRCIPACTEADPPQLTATAAGGTHPTGMHSC